MNSSGQKSGKKGGTGHLTSFEFLSALNKYIPSLVLQQLIERQESGNGGQWRLPELQSMETVVMFADISGFTKVGEACASKGVRGNEELAFCINRYMEGMVRNLGKYGGDIIKFVGDAMIIMWPPEQGKTADPELTVRKAIQCALDIQKDMNNFKVIAEVSSLSVKIGIGYGKCALLYVGGVFNRAENFTVGNALTLALKSEENADAGGQTIVNESAFRFVTKYYSYEKEIITDKNEKFYRNPKLIGEGVKTRADALAIRQNISAEMYNRIAQQLKGCVPNAIIPFLQIGAEEYGSETRSLTVMFASLGVELSSAETKEGMMKIQKIVTTVQEQVYRLRGSVNKLVMDDKGSTLICLWGLSPMAHEDDAARAILTALNMRRALNQIDNVWCNIGISSGELFSGVVGTSGGRKEFSVLGDVANLAARVMYWPKKFGQTNKIHCCLSTKQLASNYFSFNYGGHQEFKGKSISIPIFEPVDPLEEQMIMTKKIPNCDVFIKTHMNPCNLESSRQGQGGHTAMIGSAQPLLHSLMNDIVNYFQKDQCEKPLLASLNGELGSGKSLFAKCLVEQLSNTDEFLELMNERAGSKLPIFCSSLNAESQFAFLNIWRPILAQMLTFHAKREGQKREQILVLLLQQVGEGLRGNSNKAALMCELFLCNTELVLKAIGARPEDQVQPKEVFAQFVNRVKYDEDVTLEILTLCSTFVKLVIGDDELSMQGSRQQHQQEVDLSPVLVILDTAHLMDAVSWRLFDDLKTECTRIGIVMLMQTDENDRIRIHPDSQAEHDRIWKTCEDLRVIDIPALNQQDLGQILNSFAHRYQSSYNEEIMKMIEIVNPADTIKTVEMGKDWTRRLTEKWQLKNKYFDVSKPVLEAIVRKCAGNPLLGLHYFVNMMQNDICRIDTSGVVQGSQKLVRCAALDDYTMVPVPRIALKINLAAIDRHLSFIVAKQHKRPGELEDSVKQIVFLKAAAILGEEWTTQALQAVQPLRACNIDNICKNICSLEDTNFIEILDELERDNLQCRFNKPFLRETLYQVSLYRDQKKGIHNEAANYFLERSDTVCGGPKLADPGVQLRILKQHLLVSQDVEDEKELSYLSRTGLQVRHIQNMLAMNERAIVLEEMITKQGKGANKKASKRLVTLDAKHFKWFHDEHEKNANAFLGCIPVQFIFQIVASKMARGSDPTFSISTSSWINKERKEEGPRDFYFACDSDLIMENWIISLEFLRTKAVYDSYAANNISVQFPLKSGQQTRQKQIETKDIYSLLFDFGGKLKASAGGGGLMQPAQSMPRFQKNSSFRERGSVLNTYGTVRQELSGVELQNRLKTLYNVGICSFASQIQQTSMKMTVKQQSSNIRDYPGPGTELHDACCQHLEGDQNFYSGSKNNSYVKDSDQENHKLKQKVPARMERRSSAISADNVQNQSSEKSRHYKNSDLIKEETEGQTSNEEEKKQKPVRKSEQIAAQDLKLKSDSDRGLLILHKGSEESRSTTPPLSGAQVSAEKPQDDVRMTFAPAPLQKGASTLYSKDEQLDNLRSQSPPMKVHETAHSRTQSMPQEPVSLQATPPPPKEENLLQQQTSMMSGLQNFIMKSIDQGMAQMIKKNDEIVAVQREEMNKLLQEQRSLLDQSVSQRMVSMETYSTPARRSFAKPNVRNERINELLTSEGGITSVNKRRMMDSYRKERASHAGDSDGDLADPDVSDDASDNTIKQLSSNLQQKSQPTRTRPEDSMLTQKRGSDRRFTPPRAQQKQQQQTYVNFQDERLYFPPPERWVDNEYTMYEEPVAGSQSVINDKVEMAVCTRESMCQLKGPKFIIPETSQVRIVETIAHLKMYKLQYQNQIGVFLMRDFTRLQRPQQQSFGQPASGFPDERLSQMSPIHPSESMNFFKEMPDRELSMRLGQMSQKDLALQSQRILEEDRASLKAQNLKMLERQKKRSKKSF